MSLLIKQLFKRRRPTTNSMVLRSFNVKFPRATQVIWQQVDVFKWHVNFNQNKKKCTALFNSEGKWLETVTLIPMDKIPEQLQLTMEERCNSEGLQQIYYIQTPDRSIYEMNLNNGLYTLKILFDLSGRILGKIVL
jgi:hypothetical protein